MSSERPPILMQRRGAFLVPQAPIDGEMLEAFPAGKTLKVKVTQPRNVKAHRLYFAMLRLVADNLSVPVTTAALHEWVKLKTGVTAAIPLKSGNVDLVPGSIAFDQMDDDEFRSFLESAKTLIVEHLIPGLSKPALEAEARAMLGEP